MAHRDSKIASEVFHGASHWIWTLYPLWRGSILWTCHHIWKNSWSYLLELLSPYCRILLRMHHWLLKLWIRLLLFKNYLLLRSFFSQMLYISIGMCLLRENRTLLGMFPQILLWWFVKFEFPLAWLSRDRLLSSSQKSSIHWCSVFWLIYIHECSYCTLPFLNNLYLLLSSYPLRTGSYIFLTAIAGHYNVQLLLGPLLFSLV